MSETITEPAAPAEPIAPATGEPSEATPLPSDLGDAGKRAIDAMKAERDAARREARANADAAKRLEELENASKSEQQKAADAAAKAQRDAEEARAETLRYKAAAMHQITSDEDFDLLGSGDEETITRRAQRVGVLLAAVKENEQLKAELEALRTGKPVPSGRPVEQLRPGATPTQNPTEDDVLYNSLFGG